MQISSRIWTRVTVSISYDDNHYTTVNNISGMQGLMHSHEYWTIYWSSSLVHFKNSPEYLRSGTVVYPFDEISAMKFDFE